MTRGTAVSAPFALAHFLFLPAMDPIEIAHYPVRFLFFTLTYSMIFHRGVPNFSYAQEGGDESTIWISDRSAITVTVDIDDDDDVSVTIIAENTSISTDSNAGSSVSPSSSPVYTKVVEDGNISTLGLENSSTSTTDIFYDYEFSMTRFDIDMDSTTASVTSNSTDSPTNYLENMETIEDNNASMLLIPDISTVSIDVERENILNTTVDMDFTSYNNTTLITGSVNGEVEENDSSTSWVADISTMAEDFTLGSIASQSSASVVAKNVEDDSVNSTWIADITSVTTDSDTVNDVSSSQIALTLGPAEENDSSTPWVADSSTMAKDVTLGSIASQSTASVVAENVEDNSVNSTRIADITSVTTDSDKVTSRIAVTLGPPEESNSSTPWVADTSAKAKEANLGSIAIQSSTLVVAENVEEWGGLCRDGKMQSPIHITTVTTEVNPEAQPIVFINYDLASLQVSLTSHTIVFNPRPHAPGYQIGIAGGGLMGFYELNHIHLHWSNSEHAIDHNTYKMEAHMVHFKMPYGNFTPLETLEQPDGIAVLAILYELGTADPTIEDLILTLGRNLTEVEMPRVTPKSFLPDDTDEFIRYRGSLTTPPCNEVVIWTVFPSSKTLTQYQVNWLSTRKLGGGMPDPMNYRPLQDRNNREVYMMRASYSTNFIPGHLASTERGHAAATAPSIALMLTAISLFSFRSC